MLYHIHTPFEMFWSSLFIESTKLIIIVSDALAIFRQVYRTVFDPELLRSARYTGICMAYLLLYVAYGIPFLFLPIKNAKTGLSKQVTSLLISVSGISNLASRFIMAGLASTSGQRRRLFLSVSFAMNAVSFLFFPLFSDILFLSVGAVLFGFSAGKQRSNILRQFLVFFSLLLILEFLLSRCVRYNFGFRNLHQHHIPCINRPVRSRQAAQHPRV